MTSGLKAAYTLPLNSDKTYSVIHQGKLLYLRFDF